MTRVRAWRMIIKVSQVGRFVSTLSQFLSSFLPGRCGFVPVTGPVTIYSQSHQRHRAAARFDRSPRRRHDARYAFFFFSLSILFIVMIMRAVTSNCTRSCRVKGVRLIAATSNRSSVSHSVYTLSRILLYLRKYNLLDFTAALFLYEL